MPRTRNTPKKPDTGQTNTRNEKSDPKNPYPNQEIVILSKNQRNTATLKEASISQDNSVELTPPS